MSHLEQRRWQKTVKESARILNRKYWTFEEFIMTSFSWHQTKEGFDYWLWVSTKYKIHDLLWVQPRWRSYNMPIIFVEDEI
jgi:hypothetical protein